MVFGNCFKGIWKWLTFPHFVYKTYTRWVYEANGIRRPDGLTVIFNRYHKENYGSQELAAKELSNWFGKHVSRRTIYRALKEKNGNLTVGDRTVIVKYMED